MFLVYYLPVASIAQLIEQLTCNQQVVGLSPTAGSLKHLRKRKCFFISLKTPPINLNLIKFQMTPFFSQSDW